MSTSASASGRARWGYATGILLVVAASIWVRWPGFTQGGFANHDVAGILYNGMLFDAGLFPYADSIEFKAPGTFYLAWWLAEGGRSISRFQIWANGWAVASLLAVAAIGWRRWGPRAAFVAAVFYALHDAQLDTMDANYVTWAQLPSILAVGWALEAASATARRTSLVGFFVAGVCAAAAVVLKRPAGVVLLLTFAIAVANTNRPRRDRIGDFVAALAGVCVISGAVALHYAAGGQLGALWDGYVRSKWGWTYAASGTEMLAADAHTEGLFATVFFLPLPLAAAGFAMARGAPASERRTAFALAAWAVLAIAAASVGFRFYKGYFLAALPPLCLLAAAPWGIFGPRSFRRIAVQLIAILPLLPLAGRQALLVHAERLNRARPHDLGGRAIARQVRKRTRKTDKIWVWGWHLWDVYPLTGRLAGTRFYKTMELTTSSNDATWRRPRSRLHFRDGPAAEALLAELEANRPAYIVLGSAVPAAEFKALGKFLREHYRRDRSKKLNRVQFWQRR